MLDLSCSFGIGAAIIRDPLVISPDATVAAAIAQMSSASSLPYSDTQIQNRLLSEAYAVSRSSCVVVVENQQVAGILTEQHMIRLVSQGQAWENQLVRQVMIQPVVTLQESDFTDLLSTIELLEQHGIRHLPIVDQHKKLVGLVTRKTLLQVLSLLELEEIHKRSLAELEAQRFKERLQFVMSSSPAVLFTCKPDGDYGATFVSENVRAVMGYEPSDFLSDSSFWVNHIHPEDISSLFTNMCRLFEQGHHVHEYRFLHKDQTYRWLRDEMCLIRDSQGQPIEIVGYFADISDRKEAEETVRQQAVREGLLREISQKIRQSLNLQTIFETACEEIRKVIQADRVGIFKFYPESNFDDGEFAAESVVNQFPSVVAVRVHDHCFGENFSALYAKGRFQAVDDIYDDTLKPCHSSILAQFQVRANLIMPLLCADQLWGLLCIHQCSAPRHWNPSEIEFTQQLANQLAIAIQQASLYDKLQAELVVRQQAEAEIALQLRRQQALGAIVQHIRESLDLNEILATVAQQLKDVLQADRVIVLQLFADGRSRIVEEAVSDEFPKLKDRHWEDETWSQEVLVSYWSGNPRVVPDVMNDVWTDCLREYSLEAQIQSKMVAPILQDICSGENGRWVVPWATNKLWGVLVVHSCREKRLWQDSEALLLQQVANQLTVAIQQAILFQRLQQELLERQQAQQQLTERNHQLAVSNEELARATRLKDEFLANMSHELRTPLNAILGMTEGLLEMIFGKINPQQAKALQTIEHSASHLLALINDILDVAKIESGHLELDYATTAVAALCQSSLAFIKQEALKKGIQLEIKLARNLPYVLIDERRIRQVLINLLTNAVKFTPEGGRVTLEASYQQSSHPEATDPIDSAEVTPHGLLQLVVSDTGIGIASEHLQKLFQPFIQIDSALNRKYEGTGLGLALVKRIVELHGGRISVTSEVGSGSCFTVALPCAISTAFPVPKMLSEASSEFDSTDQTKSPLILLAEDNEANISTISSYLKVKGYRMLLVKNGQEAIAVAQSEHPDLIVMDIQMPGMDGLEAMQHIRADPSLATVPIIVLTALAMTGDRERCLAAGANDYLTKPVKLRHLTSVIQTLL